jgi:hypothetical protein
MLACLSFAAHAAKIKPFSLATRTTEPMGQVANSVRTKLQKAGFQILGTYQPYPSTRIYPVTSDELKRTAAATKYGGFGAVIKVAVTQVQSKKGTRQIEVSYNNPHYLGLAYNMAGNLDSTKQRLKRAIGFIEDFGGGNGVEAAELPEYNYAFGLEGFYGFFDFADFGNYEKALRKVEYGLSHNKFGVGQVYKLTIPGKQQTIYGVSLQSDKDKLPFLNDQYVMGVIDYQRPRRSAHLPYEIMVNGGKVIAMHPHFRLAVNFPDLHMFGTHSFGRLMNLPYDYQEYLIKTVGGTWPPGGDTW